MQPMACSYISHKTLLHYLCMSESRSKANHRYALSQLHKPTSASCSQNNIVRSASQRAPPPPETFQSATSLCILPTKSADTQIHSSTPPPRFTSLRTMLLHLCHQTCGWRELGCLKIAYLAVAHQTCQQNSYRSQPYQWLHLWW
jgi:hypothetical protein